MDTPQARQASMSTVPALTELEREGAQVLSSRAASNHTKPLEFVLSTPCNAKKADTRKKVRAHVMRDYHRSRRLAETRNYATQKRLESAALLLRRESVADTDSSSIETDSPAFFQFFIATSPRPALPYQDNSKPGNPHAHS